MRGCCAMGKEMLVDVFVIESMTLEALGSCSMSIIDKIFSGYIVLVSTPLHKYTFLHSVKFCMYHSCEQKTDKGVLSVYKLCPP
jgi:hypothetical protein